MSEKLPNSLLEQESALGKYLDDMLHRATQVELVPEANIEAEIDNSLLPAELLVEPEPVETETLDSVESHAEEKVEIGTKSHALTPENFPIQCLMFKVGENLLSIPLIEMQNVVKWHNKLTRLPNEPHWILGILKFRDNNVRVVDSAEILQIRRDIDQDPVHILVLGNEKWGITCDQVDKVMTVYYDDVQWKPDKANSMTLGTIRSSLSSLLNPQGIVNCLQSGQLDVSTD